MLDVVTLYVAICVLGAASGFFVLLTSKRLLNTRNVASSILGGGLLSVMVVAFTYGDARENPWPAVATAIAIGLFQPRAYDIAIRVLGVSENNRSDK